MQECNIANCAVRRPPEEMIPVRDEIDGQPIVGHACSTEHARQLPLQWTASDRYVPDELFRVVGEGRTAGAAA